MRTLDQIYGEVPEVNCKGLCHKACGPIAFSQREALGISETDGALPAMMPNGQCDKLVNGRCTIYQNRPLICRLYGAVTEMRCPHGCAPKKFLPDKDARRLLAELQGKNEVMYSFETP